MKLRKKLCTLLALLLVLCLGMTACSETQQPTDPTPAQDLASADRFSLSLPGSVMAGIMDQYGISINVYVIPHRKYVTVKNTFIPPAPMLSGTANIA